MLFIMCNRNNRVQVFWIDFILLFDVLYTGRTVLWHRGRGFQSGVTLSELSKVFTLSCLESFEGLSLFYDTG